MKRKIYILLIALLFPCIVFSQKDTLRFGWSFIAGGGIGIPTGSFANNTYAYGGTTEFISATKKITNSIYDFVCMVSYNSNNFNLDESLNGGGQLGVINTAVSNGIFQEFSALAGFAISIPKNNPGFSFNIRFLTGTAYYDYPSIAYYTGNPFGTSNDYINSNSIEKIAIFPIDVGFDFKIQLHKKVFLFFGFDYFAVGVSNSSSPISPTAVELLNYTGGIGYRFY